MPRNNRKLSNSRRRFLQGRSSHGPASSSLSYSGPTVPRVVARQEQLDEKVLSILVNVDTAGTGNFSQPIGLQGSVSSAPNWSSLSAVYDEYRVLAVRVHFTPANGYNKLVATQTCPNPIFFALDRDSVTTVSSNNTMLSYDSVKSFDIERPFTYDVFKMSGARESAFITTASPVNLGSYVNWFTGATPSLHYGVLLCQFLVQFRAAA
jgi:hypothetical protein